MFGKKKEEEKIDFTKTFEVISVLGKTSLEDVLNKRVEQGRVIKNVSVGGDSPTYAIIQYDLWVEKKLREEKEKGLGIER